MLTRLLILLFFLIIAFGYLGAKISVKTENFKHSYIFWALYVVTIITTIQIIFCIYMYSKYRTKDGDLGPRGFDGYPGKQGDDGECDQTKCRKDLLLLMVVKKIEDKMNVKLTESDIRNIEDKMNIKDVTSEGEVDLEGMTYNHVDKFNDEITYKIEVNDNPLDAITNDNSEIQIDINQILEVILKK